MLAVEDRASATLLQVAALAVRCLEVVRPAGQRAVGRIEASAR